jgi:arabinofuranan 3-O-arabinosyltransferase
VLIAAFLIAGPIGAVCAAIGVVAVRVLPQAPLVLAVLAGAGTILGEAALSTGPWRSGEVYMGGSLWAQFPALVAVVAVGVAALPARKPWGRAGSATRTGV